MPEPNGDRLPATPDGPGDGRAWALVVALSLAWGVLPAWPALRDGALIGSPWTDLYPSAWGLDWFVRHQPGLPVFAPELAAPAGMPFYYSSPVHGWLAWPLRALGMGPVGAWNATVVLARVATVACAYGAARAWGLGRVGGVAAALAWGASPFFHGYAAEGIVEGLDGWTLALLAWALAHAGAPAPAAPSGHSGLAALGPSDPPAAALRVPGAARHVATAAALALSIAASWYLGMVGCALLVGVGAVRAARGGARAAVPLAGALAGGLLLASPFVASFTGAMSGATPLPDAVRAAMGAPLAVRAPGIVSPQPFALTTWVGLLLPLLALVSARRHPAVAAFALGCFVLSLGTGPWYDLPVLRSVRFPYRWHAGTLAGIAWLAGHTLDRWGAAAFGDTASGGVAGGPPRPMNRVLVVLLAGLPWLEGILLSPIAPVLPSAPADAPLDAACVGDVLLDVPGPLAMPPGAINRSRPRARYLLWGRAYDGARSPWAPDFNGVAAGREAPWLDAWRSWDPLARRDPVPPDLAATRAGGVTHVAVHADEVGGPRARALEAVLVAGGARPGCARDRVNVWVLSP